MARFQEGDTVRIKTPCSGTRVGELYKLNRSLELVPTSEGQDGSCTCNQYWELVTDNTNTMNLKDKFALVFKGEPEKSFIKAGVMNADESLTPDGQALFMAYLLKKNGADFKTTVVDPILAEGETAK